MLTSLIILLSLVPRVLSAQAETPRILLFTPTTEGNTYWPQVYAIWEAAAEDLGITLIGHEFEVEDRFAKATEGVEILRNSGDADGAIISVAFGQTAPLLDAAEELGIPVMIQGPLFEEELPPIGFEPRQEFDQWVGYFYQDEFAKGYELGRILIRRALEEGLVDSRGVVQVVGVGGDPTWFGSELRQAGLEAAVDEVARARLMQVVPTFWTPEEGRRITAGLVGRYPEATVVWAASDQLAAGALEALRGAGRRPGSDVLVGGLDLSEVGLRLVEDGLLTATVASSLLSYAEILIYLHDYTRTLDFAPEVGTDIRLDLYTATRDTAGLHLELYRSFDRIDFRRLSRYHNRQLSSYDFSIQAYLRALEGR